jgi:hypothetical protein
MSVLAPVNKAVGAATGVVISIPAAPELWLAIERIFRFDASSVIDGVGIVIVGAVISFFTTYFFPANVPAAK